MTTVAVQECPLKVDGKCPCWLRPPVTQIRLFWDLQEHPGTTLRDAADRLEITYWAARRAHSRLLKKRGCDVVTRYCPDCLTPTVQVMNMGRGCSRCGRELPYMTSEMQSMLPTGGNEYSIASIWNHNLGTNPNGKKGLISELHKLMVREGEPYLSALGDTEWKHHRAKGEDEPFLEKLLAVAHDTCQKRGLPPPGIPRVYFENQLGRAIRKGYPEWSKRIKSKKQQLRALTSDASAQKIIDLVLKEVLA